MKSRSQNKRVLQSKWFLVAIWLGAGLHPLQSSAFGQQNPINADQVIAKYLEAIGGSDRISSITSFAEKGELSGDLESFGHIFAPPTVRKEHGTFEFYFKTPNLRFSVLRGENNVVLRMYGCDGKVAWYIGADGVRREFKPKPGSEYECEKGYQPIPLLLHAPNMKIQLKGKKKIASQITWAVRVQDPKSPATDTFYFDLQTHLLVCWETTGPYGLSSQGSQFKVERLYSDFRDVAGIKLPFMIVQQSESSALVTILREVAINAPVDDSRFEKPTILSNPREPQAHIEPLSPPTHLDKVESPVTGGTPETHPGLDATYLNKTNFVSSSFAELQQTIPELRGLKPAENQDGLSGLLNKVGDKTLDLSRNIPDLISHEKVIESRPGVTSAQQAFSYLILARRSRDSVTLEEFRVDLQSGATLQTDSTPTSGTPGSNDSQSLDDLARVSQRVSARKTGGPPLSQGFASMWIRFYPSNRSESTFRYLGRQKLDRHQTLVLAFTQKPGSVHLPAEVRFKDTSVPIFYQGVAWVDASDFRIVRLRTDLLPVQNLPLTQLTAEIQFADAQVAGFSSPYWLPREVVVTSQVNGLTFQDRHSYSEYRSFQVRSKIVLP